MHTVHRSNRSPFHVYGFNMHQPSQRIQTHRAIYSLTLIANKSVECTCDVYFFFFVRKPWRFQLYNKHILHIPTKLTIEVKVENDEKNRYLILRLSWKFNNVLEENKRIQFFLCWSFRHCPVIGNSLSCCYRCINSINVIMLYARYGCVLHSNVAYV